MHNTNVFVLTQGGMAARISKWLITLKSDNRKRCHIEKDGIIEVFNIHAFKAFKFVFYFIETVLKLFKQYKSCVKESDSQVLLGYCHILSQKKDCFFHHF